MKQIKDYEGLYSVDSSGNVYSEKKGGQMRPFHKKGRDGGKSYLRITLRKNGATKKFFIHRLVAIAFVSNQDGKPYVNHIDGNVFNNNSDNLEWVTQSENQSHAYRIGLQKPNNGVKFKNNTSGYVGVTKAGNKWKAQIRTGGVLKYLGVYSEPEEASEIYQSWLASL